MSKSLLQNNVKYINQQLNIKYQIKTMQVYSLFLNYFLLSPVKTQINIKTNDTYQNQKCIASKILTDAPFPNSRPQKRTKKCKQILTKKFFVRFKKHFTCPSSNPGRVTTLAESSMCAKKYYKICRRSALVRIFRISVHQAL